MMTEPMATIRGSSIGPSKPTVSGRLSPAKSAGRYANAAMAQSSLTGPATVILSGISLGLESAVYAALLIGGAVYVAFLIGGGAALYAVALAGCGLLTTAGVIVSMDTFGPVSDNAQGIAEMSGDLDEEGARTLTDLDAVGNTTKAITKGIAIATAVLAATALFGSYNAQIGVALDEAGATLGNAFTLVNPYSSDLRQVYAYAVLCIVGTQRAGLGGFFSTHPPTAARVKRLEEIESRLQAGPYATSAEGRVQR